MVRSKTFNLILVGPARPCSAALLDLLCTATEVDVAQRVRLSVVFWWLPLDELTSLAPALNAIHL